ncbi:MAG: molybdenum cofactor biosynthesis protein MoaE, partial [Nitrospinaceae bacterium]
RTQAIGQEVVMDIRERGIRDFGIIDMIIIHRIGKIIIGENIVLIVAAGEHRLEAFKACEWAISELKRVTPIWKSETTSKGDVWVQATP